MKSSNVNRASATKKWGVSDAVSAAIFNIVQIIILFVVTMVVSMLFTPAISYLAGAGIIAMLAGPVYLTMAGRIGKPGVFFMMAVIYALVFLAMGQTYMLSMILFGVIAELVMIGSNAYRSWNRNVLGYAVFYAGYSLCGVLPLVFFREKQISILSETYSPEALNSMMYYYGTPSMVLLMIVITLVGSILGCVIGRGFLERHIKKAKLI